MSLILPFDKYTWPLKNPEHTPFDHQIKTSTFLLANKKAFVLNDLGTGKTLSALWACDFLFINEKIKKVLITSPLSTIQAVWGNEIFYNLWHRKYAICHGTYEERLRAIRAKVHFVIINHDGLVSMEEDIIREKFDVFIIDEVTIFKNIKTNKSQAARRIAEKCRAVWGLTAEPTPNSPIEAYSQAKIVNPENEYLPPTYSGFRLLVEDKISSHLSMPTEKANEHVFKVLQPAIRFQRKDCIDIPECSTFDYPVEMTSEQTRMYNEMVLKLIAEHKEGLITASNVAVKLQKLSQIAAGWVKDNEGNVIEVDSSTRLEAIVDIWKNTHKGKLVIFSAYRAAVKGVHDYLVSKKYKSAYILGGMNPQERANIIGEFQHGSLEYIVIQPASTSHGVTLTAADTIAWHSMVPSGMIYNQANGRISRIGQTSKQSIIHLISSKVDKRIGKILELKGSMSEDLLDMFTNHDKSYLLEN